MGFYGCYLFPVHDGLHWHRKPPAVSKQAPRALQGLDAQGLTRSAQRLPRYPRAQMQRNPSSPEGPMLGAVRGTTVQLPKAQGERSQAVTRQNIPVKIGKWFKAGFKTIIIL